MLIDMEYEIKLIEELIKEDPEHTIKDYLETLSEIKKITSYDTKNDI